MLGCFLTYFCSFQSIFRWLIFSQVVQKQTLGEMVKWPVIWWPVVPEMLVPKSIKIGKTFFEWQSLMFGMFFSGYSVVGAATEKLLEPKRVWAWGADNRLVSDERNVYELECNVQEQDSDRQAECCGLSCT